LRLYHSSVGVLPAHIHLYLSQMYHISENFFHPGLPRLESRMLITLADWSRSEVWPLKRKAMLTNVRPSLLIYQRPNSQDTTPRPSQQMASNIFDFLSSSFNTFGMLLHVHWPRFCSIVRNGPCSFRIDGEISSRDFCNAKSSYRALPTVEAHLEILRRRHR
jgi:hypothetical protein